MPLHVNSFATGVDVPEVVFGRRHRRQRCRRFDRQGGRVNVSARNLLAPVREDINEDDLFDGDFANGSDEDLNMMDQVYVQDGYDADMKLESYEIWPSLQRLDDWDVCSEVSDVSSFSLVTVASEESGVTASSWVAVDLKVAEKEGPTKPTFADLLRNAANEFAELKSQKQRRCLRVKRLLVNPDKVIVVNYISEDFDDELDHKVSTRGWQKLHKASRSVKAVQKVATQTSRRRVQKALARGLDEDYYEV
jgi:hypothetical protein